MLGVAIAGIIAYGTMSTSKSVDTSDDAAAALESHMSTSLAAGTKLMSSDDNYVPFLAVAINSLIENASNK